MYSMTHYTVKSTAEAWSKVNEIFPTDYMKDDDLSNRAGYPVYESTSASYSDAYIRDLCVRFEININDTWITIWIEEDEETEEQTYTSANTSINSTKLPAVYNKVTFAPDMAVLDYGCGRYTDHLKTFCEGFGATWNGFDPFNYPTNIDGKTFDLVLCSNVLNVIDSDRAVYRVARTLAEKTRTTCVVTVYEGDRSGNGRSTKDDCYQRNERLSEYVRFLEPYFEAVKVRNGAIWCMK